jgi:hypothetical protein
MELIGNMFVSHDFKSIAAACWLFCLACGDDAPLAIETADAGSSVALHADAPSLSLTAVWGSAQDDVWAVGAAGRILHFDGQRWQRSPRVTDSDLTGLHGHSSDDIWAVGEDVALHWDGHAWTVALSNVGESLMGVWQAAADDVWMVGLAWDVDRGVLRHYDGERWQGTTIGSASTLWEVWGGADGVWIAGSSTAGEGFLARGEHTDFARASFDGGSLRGIWGTGDDDIWVAAYAGALQHWDGHVWSEYVIPELDSRLLSVAGTSARDVWAVGLHGTVARWDGESFRRIPVPTRHTLWSVWAHTPEDAWAAGGALLHWDGSKWHDVPVP